MEPTIRDKSIIMVDKFYFKLRGNEKEKNIVLMSFFKLNFILKRR
jgi:hypothetical protein